MQPRQCHRIASVGLDPFARPFRDQRRRDDQAGVPEGLDLAIEPVSRRPRFVAEVQLAITTAQLADQPLHRCRRTRHLAEKPYLTAATAIGNRDRMLGLRYIESDKGFAILDHGPPSVREARLGPSEQPSLLFCTKGRAAGLSPGT